MKIFKSSLNKLKINRIYFGILILILLALIIWASYGVLNVGKKVRIYSVSVIVNDSSNERWISLREGLEQAAEDNHITLNFVSTGKILNKKEEETLIERELENGADGLIIQMVYSNDAADLMEEISSKAAVILIETDIKPEEVYTTVMPDNMAIGKAIGKAVIDDIGKNIYRKKIGVIYNNRSELSIEKRLKGLKSSFNKSGVKIAWTLSANPDELDIKFVKKQRNDPADILITLDNDETEAVVDLLQDNTIGIQKCLIYGEGCSEKNVYYLDKGVIQTLVVPNEFNMGFLSMTAMIHKLQYLYNSADNTEIEYLVINKDNLYDTDNQKILFPIVQ